MTLPNLGKMSYLFKENNLFFRLTNWMLVLHNYA